MGEIGTVAGILVFILVVVILIVLASCIKIVPQAQAMVVERLGAYDSTWGVGIHFKVPILQRVAMRVTLMEQVVDFAPQPVMTRWYSSRLPIRSFSLTAWRIP